MVDEDGLFELDASQLNNDSSQDSRADILRRTRNSFRLHPAPEKPMSSTKNRHCFPKPGVTRSPPEDLLTLINWFEEQKQARHRFRWTLRDSLDELLDGQRTGRWCYQHLTKTEKTYLGTAIEINLTREFDISDGAHLDWRIDEADIDCKFSKDVGGWEIPMEMYLCPDHGERAGKADHPALLVWLNDDRSEWAAGLIRVTDEKLRWKTQDGVVKVRGYNRDNKRRLSEEALSSVYWLWGGMQTDLPSNLLLDLPNHVREQILVPDSSGQHRVNALFRHVRGRLINRQVVLAVGQQDDAPKRVRDARGHLRAEGIVILGYLEPHKSFARDLGLDVPSKGAWISARTVEVPSNSDRMNTVVDGRHWALADDDEISSAPILPTA
ncbi:NaeI family type II restriction endonuclease [Rhodococcoides fascians]|uniref:NaeI family type II restriction endonuclease n=1 Tax=Rhodococcoides fascians TaxID=1828 RepID=UPI001E398A7A|nr:NaeI family type II restriction endonuclease [Rhodococcus fascians]